MTEFKRGLSRDCTAALQRLAKEPAANWWKEVLANKDLFLAIRGGYLNAYVKGQSVFKIGPGVDGGKPRVEVHYKYLVAPEMEEGSPYVQFDGTKFAIDPGKVLQTRYEPGVTLKLMVRAAARFSGSEKDGVHLIAAKEPKTVDVEIAFTPNGGPDEKLTAPRMDLAVLIPDGPSAARLAFCEAKCADNSELWTTKTTADQESYISVVSQIAKYERFIGAHGRPKEIVDAYVGVCATLVELHQQGWKRELDPLVEGVATRRIPLTIHPKVYLLVYGFDGDQKKGALRTRLERLRSKEVLGHRVIAKGNPRSFVSLSSDIQRHELAART